jgi:ribonuclease BN (tRNA processing enzyme)
LIWIIGGCIINHIFNNLFIYCQTHFKIANLLLQLVDIFSNNRISSNSALSFLSAHASIIHICLNHIHGIHCCGWGTNLRILNSSWGIRSRLILNSSTVCFYWPDWSIISSILYRFCNFFAVESAYKWHLPK